MFKKLSDSATIFARKRPKTMIAIGGLVVSLSLALKDKAQDKLRDFSNDVTTAENLGQLSVLDAELKKSLDDLTNDFQSIKDAVAPQTGRPAQNWLNAAEIAKADRAGSSVWELKKDFNTAVLLNDVLLKYDPEGYRSQMDKGLKAFIEGCWRGTVTKALPSISGTIPDQIYLGDSPGSANEGRPTHSFRDVHS